MKFLKTFSAMMVALAAVLIIAGCGTKPRYKIGVSQPSDDEWRTQMNEEIHREILFHDDATVEVRSANDNSELQIADIRYFIDHNFDIIIASPREAETISPVLREAYEKGIPIIIFDRAVKGDCYTSYVELDNEGIGREAAKYAANLFRGSKVNVIEIRGLDGSSPAEERHLGFSSTADSIDNMDILASVSGGWTGEGASFVTDSLLKAHPEANLIYAQNDVMALAAAKAAERLGRGDVKVLGTDAAPQLGIRAVADSLIHATFIYPTEGHRVIRLATDILHGLPVPKVLHVPSRYPVDAANAGVLLRQDELLKDKTNQISTLQQRNTLIKSRQQTQLWVSLAVGMVALALIATAVLLVRNLRQKRRYQTELTAANSSLRKERDHQQDLYKRLEEATNSKLVFFTNVSHDLRTPLTLISEPVNQLASSPRLTEQERSMLEIAVRNVKILRRMIDQILDFRRYQNEKADIGLVTVNPSELLADWTSSFKAVAEKRKIKYEVNVEGKSFPEFCVTDAEKLERIVFNLLSNAFKYSPDGSRICIDATWKDGIMHLKVRDTGRGISEDELPFIYDRFYQVDKRSSSGSGIGLSLTKAYVELLGGKISVESTLGKGTRFSVSLPLSAAMNREMPEETMPKKMSSQSEEIIEGLAPAETEASVMDSDLPLLLVIDDNPDIREIIDSTLEGIYNVIGARDGETGVKLAFKYVPDVIICDVMMPGIDGFETVKKIKAEKVTSHIPVLMLTACRLDEQRVQSYDSGADAYISKPYGSELLKSRVASLLANRARIREHYEAEFADGSASGGNTRSPLPATNDPHELESGFYRDFLKVVRERYRDSELTLQEVASEMAIGSTQLTRKIKALTGLSPLDIIRNLRLRQARVQLLSTELSIADIAYGCGFSSPQYFSKCFRDYYHMTPTELRNGH